MLLVFLYSLCVVEDGLLVLMEGIIGQSSVVVGLDWFLFVFEGLGECLYSLLVEALLVVVDSFVEVRAFLAHLAILDYNCSHLTY